MIKPKLILFDIGGVLIEYKNAFVTVSKVQHLPHDIILSSYNKYNEALSLGKITPQEFYLKCLKENGLKADTNYDFLLSWNNDFEIIKPAFNYLLNIANQSKIGVFSNIHKGAFQSFIGQNLIPNVNYEYIFLSCELGMEKPNQNIYEYVVKNTGLIGEEIFFIDDNEDNITQAQKMKWQTHKFDRENPQTSVNQLSKILN
ncbi:hypothetical protein CO178_02305 [candidate division WWE3 bacterium CG_4_9_14_3_um_filter_34_6]|uniref:HAD family phosphatase n=1 Tax=candidate division WWE3 bacterium CG_4_9_14_3_um_filter_34_6 TaxID=1975079 RepID=A0A2M7X2J4_UNCKA|nr:MAG: hypothetical protein CO178_02305 [candidate division WWE3 bacterium CG_4_9_14_3_um_filter_34_6]